MVPGGLPCGCLAALCQRFVQRGKSIVGRVVQWDLVSQLCVCCSIDLWNICADMALAKQAAPTGVRRCKGKALASLCDCVVVRGVNWAGWPAFCATVREWCSMRWCSTAAFAASAGHVRPARCLAVVRAANVSGEAEQEGLNTTRRTLGFGMGAAVLGAAAVPLAAGVNPAEAAVISSDWEQVRGVCTDARTNATPRAREASLRPCATDCPRHTPAGEAAS